MSISDQISPAARNPSQPSVLIADDDPVVARLLAELVRQQGWRPLVAADAMQAVMFAVRGEPSAIVLDILMPGGTGVDVLRKLKGNVKTALIPVVVLSGSPDPSLPERVLALGADAFLPKPLDPEQMRDRLQAILGDGR